MKNYSEIYVSLREEIMQEIWNLEDFIKTEFDVSSFTELNNPPELYGDAWNCKTGNLTLDTIHITDICVDKVEFIAVVGGEYGIGKILKYFE